MTVTKPMFPGSPPARQRDLAPLADLNTVEIDVSLGRGHPLKTGLEPPVPTSQLVLERPLLRLHPSTAPAWFGGKRLVLQFARFVTQEGRFC